MSRIKLVQVTITTLQRLLDRKESVKLKKALAQVEKLTAEVERLKSELQALAVKPVARPLSDVDAALQATRQARKTEDSDDVHR